MIQKVSFGASRDDGRHYLNGVHFSLSSVEDKTLLRMAATDGTRLAKKFLPRLWAVWRIFRSVLMDDSIDEMLVTYLTVAYLSGNM
jgi:hypothetical protein